jgi:recombination protein RecA
VDEVISALNKKFGKTIIQPASKMKGLEIERISTGIISLDIETGGGLPKSRLIEIYGHESSGKTYVCLHTVAEAQKQLNKKCLWIDMEGVFDPEWSKKVGVNLDLLDLAKPETAEQAGTILDTATRSNNYSIIILDSVAAMLPQEDLDKAMDDSERIGNRAMVNNRIVRKLQSALNAREDGEIPNETMVIFINQVRENIGVVYGNPDETPGGKGIRFMASIRIEMRRSDLIKETPLDGETGKTPDGKMIIGVTIKFKTTKNKTACPLKTGQFILYTDRERLGQVDRVDEITRYGIMSGVIKHAGPSYSIGERKFLGKEALGDFLKENPEEIVKIYEEVKKIYV